MSGRPRISKILPDSRAEGSGNRTNPSPLFGSAQLLARAVEAALGAQGSFAAMNNRVSQSVPHLHIHIVPRRRHDGPKGFLWPRSGYPGAIARLKREGAGGEG